MHAALLTLAMAMFYLRCEFHSPSHNILFRTGHFMAWHGSVCKLFFSYVIFFFVHWTKVERTWIGNIFLTFNTSSKEYTFGALSRILRGKSLEKYVFRSFLSTLLFFCALRLHLFAWYFFVGTFFSTFSVRWMHSVCV